MSKYDALRTAFKGRSARVLTVLALVGAIAIPNAMSAISATGDQQLFLRDGGPCAVFDTRFWDMDTTTADDDGAKLAAGESALFLIAGSDSTTNGDWTFYDQPETTETVEAHQGADKDANPGNENPDGCGVPDHADGVLLNLHSIFSEADGNLQIGPSTAADEEIAAALIFDSSAYGQSNMLTVEIAPGDDNQGHLKVRNNSSSPVHVRGEVLGWTCDADGFGGCTP